VEKGEEVKRLTFEFNDPTDDTKLFCGRVGGAFTVKELEQILQAVVYELQMAISREQAEVDILDE
jgi:hypothetical protein